jgi:hypothetical protein
VNSSAMMLSGRKPTQPRCAFLYFEIVPSP